MPPLNTRNHEIEVSFRTNNKHEERDDVRPSRTSSNADIRNELCRLQLRCKDLEQDRNYHAVKANELQATLEAYSSDDIQETLMKKSMQIAEASMDVDRLHLHIRKLEAKINGMKTERETERVNMINLSDIVRFLQSCQESDEEEEGGEEHRSCQQAQEATVVAKPSLKKNKSKSSLAGTSKNMNISFYRRSRLLKKMNSVHPVLTTSEKAEVLSSLKGTSIDPNNAWRMEIKIGDFEGQYYGHLRNSLPHGTGTIRFRNGDTYLGELVDGEMHGKGSLYHRSKDSGISRGYFEHNVFVGVEKKPPLRMRR
jgi:hypothetical protein